jgi:hypothetical protein
MAAAAIPATIRRSMTPYEEMSYASRLSIIAMSSGTSMFSYFLDRVARFFGDDVALSMRQYMANNVEPTSLLKFMESHATLVPIE